jgi:hypothetical protein
MTTKPEPSELLAQRRDLRAQIDAVGLSVRRAAIERLAKPGVAMRTRDATERDLAPGASRVGGDPDLPHGAPWPTGAEGPLLFVLQVDLAAVSPLDLDAVLPPDGLLSLFVDRWGQEALVVHTPPETTLVSLATDRYAPRRFRACGVDLFAELHLAPPQGPAIDDEAAAWTSDERDLYWDSLWLLWRDAQRPGPAGASGIHQMLGYPLPESADTIERGDVVLFGADSDDRADMEWGDVHTLWVTLDPADLAARAWSRVRVTM